MHGELHIAAYPFHGYWEDVGSLKNYYAANMAMAADTSKLRLFDREQPLYSEVRVLPPSKLASDVVPKPYSPLPSTCGLFPNTV
jgi:glucose-1-phosphate adenylyltransferase